jgi:putative endonuclease
MTGGRTPQQRAGDQAEDAVAEHLIADGWVVLGRNVRIGRGELDLVAVDPGPPRMLVAVEVRWRRDRGFGLPEETFDRRKRAHLRRAVSRLVAMGALPDGSSLPSLPVRIDLFAVEPPERPVGPPRLRHHRFALEG